MPKDNNVLVHAPHTASVVLADSWDRPYTREQAAFPCAPAPLSRFMSPLALFAATD